MSIVVEPMLAHYSSTIAPTAEQAVGVLAASPLWRFELKFDGVRVITLVDHGKVTMWSRRGNDCTHRYPEVVEALGETYSRRRVVLDGEMIVCVGGKPSFSAIHKRDAQGSAATAKRAAAHAPAQYILFDLPELRDRAYQVRHMILSGQYSDFPEEVRARLGFSQCWEDGETMWRFALENRLEGLVAKKASSQYRGGRWPDWIKLKPRRRLTALVQGVEPGEGGRTGSIGALFLALIQGQNLVSIGKVGSGFSEADLAELAARLSKGDPLAVDVEYMEVSPARQLRHPVYVGINDDVDPLSCTADQLEN